MHNNLPYHLPCMGDCTIKIFMPTRGGGMEITMENIEKQFYTMKELGKIIPIGTSNLYNLVHSDCFPSITVNRRIIIPIDAFNEWIKSSSGKTINL